MRCPTRKSTRSCAGNWKIPDTSTLQPGSRMSQVQKRQLLKKLLHERLSANQADKPRLTAAQLRIWQHEKYSSSPNVHVFALAYYLDGPVDEDLLRRALVAVAARHFGLRARIVECEECVHFEAAAFPSFVQTEEIRDD